MQYAQSNTGKRDTNCTQYTYMLEDGCMHAFTKAIEKIHELHKHVWMDGHMSGTYTQRPRRQEETEQ
jgi:hypothetical protein